MLKRAIAFLLVVIFLFGVFPGLISWADYLKKEPAYQFIVDGEVWFTVADHKALQEMITDYQKQFLANVDPDAEIKKVSFVQDVQVVPTEVRKDQLDSIEYARERIYAVEDEAVEITIKKGTTSGTWPAPIRLPSPIWNLKSRSGSPPYLSRR